MTIAIEKLIFKLFQSRTSKKIIYVAKFFIILEHTILILNIRF